MFRRLHESPKTVVLRVNGHEMHASTGDTVAAALLVAGHHVFRRTVRTGAVRGPYCAMGTCFECLVTIDGQQSVQACLVQVRSGMVIETAAISTLMSS